MPLDTRHWWRKIKRTYEPSNRYSFKYDGISYPSDTRFKRKVPITDNKSSGTSVSRRDRIQSEIVLLDTASEITAIQCISIPFNESVPAYYAISYRWGEHPEWKAETPNYVASITSISQGNLIKLCKYYRRKIGYLWIDVICINQADKQHRKMAIKNMDTIYRRAKRIIAVPDLCYCEEYPLMEDVTKQNIEATIINMSRNYQVGNADYDNMKAVFDINEPGTYRGFWLDTNKLYKKMKPWNESKYFFRDLDHYTNKKERLSISVKGYRFISRIITEWAERAWVVSERIIGVTGRKLLVPILRANTVAYWDIFRQVDWSFDLGHNVLVRTILESKSTNPINRLFAILPHTKYKDAVQKLVDEDTSINDEEDLKWALFDVLDMRGKNDLLDYLIDEHGKYRDNQYQITFLQPS